MGSLVRLHCYLWFVMTKLQNAEKIPLLDIPVSTTGLFGEAVEGFTERCIIKQMQSQTMQHLHFFFLIRSSAAAQPTWSCSSSSQYPAKVTSNTVLAPLKTPKRSVKLCFHGLSISLCRTHNNHILAERHYWDSSRTPARLGLAPKRACLELFNVSPSLSAICRSKEDEFSALCLLSNHASAWEALMGISDWC